MTLKDPKFDETVAFILRAAIIGMLGWVIMTTNNTARMLDVVEWRLAQVERALNK